MPDRPVLPVNPVLVPGGRDDTAAGQMAASRALLGRVSDGDHPPALRVYRPDDTVAFSRRETHRPRYVDAVAAAGRHGFEPVVRNTGGHAVAYGPGCVVVDLMAPDPAPATAMRARFGAFGAVIAETLTGLGVPATVGTVPGEYCPGEFSVVVDGRVKLAGTAQRIVRRAWLCSASIVVRDPLPLRAVLDEVYRYLDTAWRPRTLAAVADLVPSVSVAAVESAVIAALVGAGPATSAPVGADRAPE